MSITEATTCWTSFGMVGVPMPEPESFSCSDPKVPDAQTRNSEAIKHRTPLRTHRRRSGKLFTSDEDPLALLEPLSMKTRAFTQSSVCALFDEDVRGAFGSMATDELKGQVKVISRLAQAYGTGITAQAFSEALRATSKMRPADVEMCCARIRAQGTRAKAARELGTRLADYDGFMLRGGDRDGQAAAEG